MTRAAFLLTERFGVSGCRCSFGRARRVRRSGCCETALRSGPGYRTAEYRFSPLPHANASGPSDGEVGCPTHLRVDCTRSRRLSISLPTGVPLGAPPAGRSRLTASVYANYAVRLSGGWGGSVFARPMSRDRCVVVCGESPPRHPHLRGSPSINMTRMMAPTGGAPPAPQVAEPLGTTGILPQLSGMLGFISGPLR
jgi:hypothetical protein